ncbi:MAG: hypothetical protein K1000chlam1_00473 [Candidatus Anoxychlamydiales bacterium]|nr:hypothetical protein [Candidatus Anoxychlamydiales bacterium]
MSDMPLHKLLLLSGLSLSTTYVTTTAAGYVMAKIVKHPALLLVPIPAYVLYEIIQSGAISSSSNSILDLLSKARIVPRIEPSLAKVKEVAARDLGEKAEIPREEEIDRRYDSEAIKAAMEDPIDFELMKEPLLLKCCGQTLEKSTIDKWLEKHTCCPLCNANITKADLVPNRTFKTLLEAINKRP